MTVRVYRSTDAGAPTLSGMQGSLISVLSACLTGPSFNGTGNAYGSIPCAGWSRPFTGTNLAAFKQPATARGRYLLVDESTADAAARLTGYENMSSINTGTGPFPSTQWIYLSQLFIVKSSVMTTAARPWMIVATDKMFYFWVNANGDVPVVLSTYCRMFSFGDFVSVSQTDQYNTALIADSSAGISFQGPFVQNSSMITSISGVYFPRSYSQVGSSVQGTLTTYGFNTGGSVRGQSGMPCPNPADGKIYLNQTMLMEMYQSGLTAVFRGQLPGLWTLPHYLRGFINDGDIITGVDGHPGKTFEAKLAYAGSGQASFCLLETSDTW